MRAILLLAALLLLSPRAGDAQPGRTRVASGCFQQHLREAIQLNRERLPLYSRLTQGASERLSQRLILSERLALPVAWYVDRRAARYQRAGIPLVCEEFVSMELAPPFRVRSPSGPQRLASFHPVEPGRIRSEVRTAFRTGGFPRVSATLEAELDALEEAPAFHCMLRHLLESALRIANLAPIQAARAEQRGLPSPEDLSWLLLRLHLMTLEEAARLDRAAAPLQAEGIPIVCQDVPPIAPLPEGLVAR